MVRRAWHGELGCMRGQIATTAWHLHDAYGPFQHGLLVLHDTIELIDTARFHERSTSNPSASRSRQ